MRGGPALFGPVVRTPSRRRLDAEQGPVGGGPEEEETAAVLMTALAEAGIGLHLGHHPAPDVEPVSHDPPRLYVPRCLDRVAKGSSTCSGRVSAARYTSTVTPRRHRRMRPMRRRLTLAASSGARAPRPEVIASLTQTLSFSGYQL